MLLHGSLLLLFLNCVRTAEYVYDYGLENSATKFDRFSFWPSTHNAMQMMHLRKRDTQEQPAGPSEGVPGGDVGQQLPPVAAVPLPPAAPPPPAAPTTPPPAAPPAATAVNTEDKQDDKKKQAPPNVPASTYITTPAPQITTVANSNEAVLNVNATAKANPTHLDFNKPGVFMRIVIVFGGFLLLGVAYFMFYRGKANKNDASNAHSTNDANQFRYGVLQSEDRRDNLELSRIPLTMESDDDDDDDLEIFDLEQKRKSLSYMNLETNDEDIVFNNSAENSRTNDRDNLLLDIEDAASDTLINWTNNGNKSIL